MKLNNQTKKALSFLNKRPKDVFTAFNTISYCYDESADAHREDINEGSEGAIFTTKELNTADLVLLTMKDLLIAAIGNKDE